MARRCVVVLVFMLVPVPIVGVLNSEPDNKGDGDSGNHDELLQQKQNNDDPAFGVVPCGV